MKWLFWAVGAALLACVVIAVAMRSLSHDAARWHVDPETVSNGTGANAFLLAGAEAIRFDAPPERVAEVLHRLILAEPGADLITGTPQDGWMSYVVTSRLFAFPDYVSVRVAPEEGGARLSIYSRARIGRSDLGVNRARVLRWVDALRGEFPERS